MMSRVRPWMRNIVALLLGMTVPVTAALAAEDHVIPLNELHHDAAAVTQTRQANLAKAERFFKLEPVEKALRAAKLDGDQVLSAVSFLSDAELARLASRVDTVQTDFAAGALDNEHLTYIVIALAAAVLVIVIVAAR